MHSSKIVTFLNYCTDVSLMIAIIQIYLFSMCGFSNAITFMAIDEDDINHVENFVKEDMLQYFIPRPQDFPKFNDENSDIGNPEADLQGEMKQYFFGIYSSNPSSFVFLRGERKLLKALVSHVESIQAKSECLKHFQLKDENGVGKIKINWKGTFQSNFGMHFGEKKAGAKHKKTTMKKTTYELKNDLFEKYEKLIRVCYNNVATELSSDLVEIAVLSDTNIDAKVQCIFCYEKKQFKKISVHCKMSENSHYWVFSNLKRHIDQNHKGHSNNGCATNVPYGHEKSFNMTDNGTFAEDDESTSQHDEKEHPQSEDIIFTQLTIQNLKMKNAVSMHKEKITNFSFNLSDNVAGTIDVTKIKKDGNCMFGALAHQIFCVKINSTEHQTVTQELRKKSTAYIKENYALFAHDIKGRLLDQNPKSKDYDKDCMIFVNQVLPRLGCWGGIESLKAISIVYRINVLIFCEDGDCYYAPKFNADYERSVFIAFRDVNKRGKNLTGVNKNHYDSVGGIADEVISECSKHCADVLMKIDSKTNSNSIVSINDSILSQAH